MTPTRPLSVLLSLTLIGTLGACSAKRQPQAPQPAAEPAPTEPEPTQPPERAAVPDRTPPEEPERPSTFELRRMAEEFNREGALRMIFFETDKADLRPEASRILAANADWLDTHPEFAVLVAGHCDERNTAEYNLALGERRAEAVRSYLLSLGVSEARIRTISYGEERPLDPGRTESAWAKNRRAEFEVRPLTLSSDS